MILTEVLNGDKSKIKELALLQASIRGRIEEFDLFFEENADDPRIIYFEKQRLLLRKLLQKKATIESIPERASTSPIPQFRKQATPVMSSPSRSQPQSLPSPPKHIKPVSAKQPVAAKPKPPPRGPISTDNLIRETMKKQQAEASLNVSQKSVVVNEEPWKEIVFKIRLTPEEYNKLQVIKASKINYQEICQYAMNLTDSYILEDADKTKLPKPAIIRFSSFIAVHEFKRPEKIYSNRSPMSPREISAKNQLAELEEIASRFIQIDKKWDGGLKPTTNQYKCRINRDGSVLRMMESKSLTPNISIKSITKSPRASIARRMRGSHKDEIIKCIERLSPPRLSIRDSVNRKSSPSLLKVKKEKLKRKSKSKTQKHKRTNKSVDVKKINISAEKVIGRLTSQSRLRTSFQFSKSPKVYLVPLGVPQKIPQHPRSLSKPRMSIPPNDPSLQKYNLQNVGSARALQKPISQHQQRRVAVVNPYVIRKQVGKSRKLKVSDIAPELNQRLIKFEPLFEHVTSEKSLTKI